MSPRPASRLWRSLREGGLREVVRDVSGYVAWRMSGSPPEPMVGRSIEERLADVESALGVLIATRVSPPDPETSPLVSVVLPTRDRPDLLRRAVTTVEAQTYSNWELLVVDDSDGLESSIRFDDARVRVLQSGGKGVGAARNLGLDESNGELLTFLDDDNVMDPGWLKAVVAAFEKAPDATVLIGAQVVLPEPGATDAPRVRFPQEFDWGILTRYNYVDLGMLAHRRMPHHRFDEALPAFLDWDYVVRMTAEHSPTMVPVISGIYHTDAPGRVSFQERRELRDTLQRHFVAMSPRHSSVSGLTAEDAEAIDHLLSSLSLVLGRPPRVLLTGDLDPIRPLLDRHKLDTRRRAADGTPVSEHDLWILGSPDAPIPDRAVAGEVVLLGLGAHLGSYADRFAGMGNQRRVGDQLWVAGGPDTDLQGLFPGIALVKLGFEPEEPPGRAGPDD